MNLQLPLRPGELSDTRIYHVTALIVSIWRILERRRGYEGVDTYDDLDITCAMNLPVDVERPATFSSNSQLAAFGRRKLEDGVWICRMGHDLGHGWLSSPKFHVRY